MSKLIAITNARRTFLCAVLSAVAWLRGRPGVAKSPTVVRPRWYKYPEVPQESGFYFVILNDGKCIYLNQHIGHYHALPDPGDVTYYDIRGSEWYGPVPFD